MCVAKGHGPASRHRPPSPRLLLLREVSRATHTGRRASWLAHGPSCGHWARTLVGYLAVSRVKSSLRGAAVSVSEKGITPGPVYGSRMTSESFMQRKKEHGVSGEGLREGASVKRSRLQEDLGKEHVRAQHVQTPGLEMSLPSLGSCWRGVVWCVAERERRARGRGASRAAGLRRFLSQEQQSLCLLRGF